MNETALEMFVIYFNPKDFPNLFVVRRWTVDGGRPLPTPDHWIANSLDDARGLVPYGLVPLARDPSDDPVIVESWI